MTTSSNYQYALGGALRSDSPTYVTRQVDEELYQALKTGDYCYVFNSRQMGKSSLRVRVMQLLKADGIACGVVEVASIVEDGTTSEQWYLGIIRRLCRSLGVKLAILKWWRDRDGLSPIQRFSEFIEDVLLTSIEQPIVIFIDEIDSLFRFDFNDDFFVLIRSLYQMRSDKNVYDRLTFVLIGVATPTDLVRDKQLTSFNIGARSIDLKGFQLDEIEPLESGLTAKANNPKAVLAEVLNWTGGQPFLTQRVCQQIADSNTFISIGEEHSKVNEIVRNGVINDWEAKDISVHLKTIRDRLLVNEERIGRLLELYQQILSNPVDVEGTPEQVELRLAGLVVEDQGKLRVANQIYQNTFNHVWVEKQLAQLRPYAEAINSWLTSNCRDESRLLRGQALLDAQDWSTGKSLSDEDYQFLTASQQAEKQVVEYEKKLAEDQLKALEKAKKELTESFQKVKSKQNNVPSKKLVFRNFFWAVGATLATYSLSILGIFDHAESLSRDALHRLRGERPWSDEIIIVDIDDTTINKLNEYPLSRKYYAELLQKLIEVDNRVVAFDLLMSEPDDDDQLLAEAMVEHGGVILAATLAKDGQPLNPNSSLIENATAIGHIDDDRDFRGLDFGGITRRHRLFIANSPSLAASTAAVYDLIVDIIALPQFPNNELLINWPGPINDSSQSLTYVNLSDILDNKIPDEKLINKIVLVGSSAQGIDQDIRTPFDENPPIAGFYVYAAVLSNLLEGDWLRPLSRHLSFFLIFVIGLMMSYISTRSNNIFFVVCIAIGISLLWLFISYLLFVTIFYVLFTVTTIINIGLIATSHILQISLQRRVSQGVNEQVSLLLEQYINNQEKS